ncbi:hypothetical protein ACT6QE_00390, partial [Staphylococcus aureus]
VLCASTRSVKPVFNRVLCPSYQGFRIYRETLSRFSCAASLTYSRNFSFIQLDIDYKFTTI